MEREKSEVRVGKYGREEIGKYESQGGQRG